MSSLPELDSAIARHITGDVPKTYWEDSHAHLQCATFEEALEALHDPYFQQFTPAERDPSTVLREVKVYRPYSTDLEEAWALVEKLSGTGGMKVWLDGGGWAASFGDQPPVHGRPAALAICLAALRARGIEVELDLDPRPTAIPGMAPRRS